MLGLLLAGRPEYRWHYVAVRGAAGLGAHLAFGDARAVRLIFAAGGALQLGIAGAWLQGGSDTMRLLAEPGALARFLTWGLALPPIMAGAAVGAAMLVIRPDTVMRAGLSVWRNWTMASAMGLAVLTPLILSIRQGEWQGRCFGEDGRGNRISLLACLATIAVVFIQPTYPLLFLPIPLMLLVASRTGLFCTAAVIAGAGFRRPNAHCCCRPSWPPPC